MKATGFKGAVLCRSRGCYRRYGLFMQCVERTTLPKKRLPGSSGGGSGVSTEGLGMENTKCYPASYGGPLTVRITVKWKAADMGCIPDRNARVF